MDGRFDLAGPSGTCYLASDPVTALRERLGPTLAGTGVVYDFDVENVVISRLRAPAGPPIADTAAASAVDFGVTREICTTIDYCLTQMWAAELHAARFGGIRYQPRLSTSATTFSFAFFGPAGAGSYPVDTAPTRARDVAALAGIRVLETPGRSEVRVVSPPGPAAHR